ncbi:hypothetical protein EVAR_97410_1 [Eumeta japonica]|uniref:Uncharacterized protein n=1 Tax=Eumeta variegata TaxID=151549 RepID=A0A4C1X0V1_EUMVA|nr:hypothetical protein EVAR_97410_1 [Eumeta japonica]
MVLVEFIKRFHSARGNDGSITRYIADGAACTPWVPGRSSAVGDRRPRASVYERRIGYRIGGGGPARLAGPAPRGPLSITAVPKAPPTIHHDRVPRRPLLFTPPPLFCGLPCDRVLK